jgi:hypothetical protein
MENKILTRTLKRQLDHVIIHEQVENGVAINNNLSVDQIDQQFVTLRRNFQSQQIYLWIEERPTSHRTP